MVDHNYPDRMIRGISNKNCIFEDTVTAELFTEFKDTGRTDEFKELSISWLDNDGALRSVLEQTKEDGTLQFKYGAAILMRDEIDKQKLKNKLINTLLSYERSPLNANPYHGNLLLKNDANRLHKYMVASALALNCFQRIITSVEEYNNK